MADGFVRMRAGEKRPLYGQASAASGTLTISGSPTCTLYDSGGAIVSGFNAIAVTGNDSGAIANPRVWYDLDTSAAGPGGLLAAGFFTMAFKFTVSGSDGLTRVYEPSIEIQILDAKL